MGGTVTYLGHVSIEPGLNQAEFDHLWALTEPWLHPTGRRRRTRPGGACHLEPCGRGCCLSWDGTEKFHAGVVWLDYLIADLLGPGAMARSSRDKRFADFTFDHRLDGLLVGERSWSRELFAIRVVDNVVSQEVLRPGEPLEWESGWDGSRRTDRPWLARDREPWRSSLDDPPPELAGLSVLPGSPDG